jgi:hypothetical protein
MNRNVFLLLSAIMLFGTLAGYPQKKKSQAPQPPLRAAIDGFDNNQFAEALAKTQDKVQRLGIIARRWEAIKPVIAYINVMDNIKFYKSSAFWQYGYLQNGQWTGFSEGDLKDALLREGKTNILVKGDCLNNISSSDTALVHIYGNLNAELNLNGHSEVIIGGDVTSKGIIKAQGITNIYVGGNVEGSILNSSMSVVWINGKLRGEVTTGTPSTSIHIIGAVAGRIFPAKDAALLDLDVHGFMAWNLLAEIGKYPYTEFSASVGISDKPAGIYKSTGKGRGTWVIHNRVLGSR